MKKVFITGATGFVGNRLSEVLCEKDYEVVAMVRTWSRASRLARLSAKMLPGNILDIASLRSAMAGCDTVFHCAVDNRVWGEEHKRTSIEGTRNVMQAALECGVKRVVHLSSTAVFGYQPEAGNLDESSPVKYSNDSYCDGKLESEKVALEFYKEHNLPVTVLRPTIVYGPFGDYSRDTVDLIRQKRMVLVNGGAGVCNALYVDNLIEAMFLAAESDKAAGEVFHISDAGPITWREFIEGHANALTEDREQFPSQSYEEIAQNWIPEKKITSLGQAMRLIRDPKTHEALYSIPLIRNCVEFTKRSAAAILTESARSGIRRIIVNQNAVKNGQAKSKMNEARPAPLSRAEVNMLTAYEKTVFKIDKAQKILGYQPAIDFTQGMALTAKWIQWARL